MTQKQVAEKVDMLPKTISALEAVSATSTLDSLFTLLSAYGYTIELTQKVADTPSAFDW